MKPMITHQYDLPPLRSPPPRRGAGPAAGGRTAGSRGTRCCPPSQRPGQSGTPGRQQKS
jgi:hypothetical protein